VLLLSSFVFAQASTERLVAEGQVSPALEKSLCGLIGKIGGRTRQIHAHKLLDYL
jgi:hypothetical protein